VAGLSHLMDSLEVRELIGQVREEVPQMWEHDGEDFDFNGNNHND
jgi:hypothetical protein